MNNPGRIYQPEVDNLSATGRRSHYHFTQVDRLSLCRVH